MAKHSPAWFVLATNIGSKRRGVIGLDDDRWPKKGDRGAHYH